VTTLHWSRLDHIHSLTRYSLHKIHSAFGSLILQVFVLIFVLGGLSALRRDAEVLVLGPLRRMLKNVARYAKNPLVPAKLKLPRARPNRTRYSGRVRDDSSISTSTSDDDSVDASPKHAALGSFETEQLIIAVTKITDMLRKCWGVAGADIISTNLATREGALTEVFNPTVPGKSVYALFGFASIDGFDHALRSLGGDVMILINDLAAVLHGEIFRWGLGDSGQCNKNLGSAFLMVYRIGLVREVIEKLEQATDVVFSTGTTKSSAAKRRHKVSRIDSAHAVTRVAVARSTASGVRAKAQRHASVKAMSLNLSSLPGISTFTDRAVIGMLKSYAGIHRDNKLRNWQNDFRLGAGVGTFTVGMKFGMDAGWAVEGAVGSEHKIDATYLSPHVNMASRMMMACRQYGVTIMLSQSVQELMSDMARSKLRHLDTVTVKGSSIKQRIYTYDARHKGVDFFLYGRSDEQADWDADRYSPHIWHNDQDLKAMRQHVTLEFSMTFEEGRQAYIEGDWPLAIEKLTRANEIMMETAIDEGYLEDEFEELHAQVDGDSAAAMEELKRENGDGPSMFLLNFMKANGGVAPVDWAGWHPLTSK
jgi:Adenylate and Guanylate cyclase catalytic domain